MLWRCANRHPAPTQSRGLTVQLNSHFPDEIARANLFDGGWELGCGKVVHEHGARAVVRADNVVGPCTTRFMPQVFLSGNAEPPKNANKTRHKVFDSFSPVGGCWQGDAEP